MSALSFRPPVRPGGRQDLLRLEQSYQLGGPGGSLVGLAAVAIGDGFLADYEAGYTYGRGDPAPIPRVVALALEALDRRAAIGDALAATRPAVGDDGTTPPG
jgi:hypothetical protein